jgi:predicted transcriptional regulator
MQWDRMGMDSLCTVVCIYQPYLAIIAIAQDKISRGPAVSLVMRDGNGV